MLRRLTEIAGGFPDGQVEIVGAGEHTRAIGGQVQYVQREHEMEKELGVDTPSPDLTETAMSEYIDALNRLASVLGYEGIVELDQKTANEFIAEQLKNEKYEEAEFPAPPVIKRPEGEDPVKLEEYYNQVAVYIDQVLQSLESETPQSEEEPTSSD